MTRFARCLAVVGIGLALIAACTQDVGLIDRVQPGALQKAAFQGEWYFQRTVVDAPYTVGFTFIGEAEELERIRWEISEDHLSAYRAYDFVAGTDLDHSKRGKPGENVTGQPVAVYKISKHFDITRGYSEATGEQDNVLHENDQDKPWYDRQYIRVDWSENLARNFNFTLDTIETEPVKFAITDPADPDAFTMAWRDASKPSGWRDSRDPIEHREAKNPAYMDFVTKVLATPGVISGVDDWGAYSYPVCWFYLNEDCKPAEIEVRTSLRRVDPNDDYEPLDYPDNYVARDAAGKPIKVVEYTDGTVEQDPTGSEVRIPMFDKFGYFRAERFGYDDKLGEVESARRLMISRWNLWQKSKDADGKSIPYAQRTPRPVVYWLSQGFPAELRTTATLVAQGWNKSFKRTVAALQGKPVDQVPDMYVVRDNTLSFDAKGKVLDRGQRTGDLRYPMLNYIEEPTRAGLLGYGPTATDPTTGEAICATANVYGGPLKEFATSGRDLVRLMRGEIDPMDYGLGEIGQKEVLAALGKFASVIPAPPPQAGKTPLPGQGKGNGGADPWAQWAKQDDGPHEANTPEHTDDVARARAFAQQVTGPAKQKLVQQLKKTTMKGRDGWAQARAALVRDTPLAAATVNREILAAFGSPQDKAMLADLPPGAPLPALSKEQIARLTPDNWAPLAARRRMAKREEFLNRHTIELAAFADDSVLGLVADLKDKPVAEVWTSIHASVFRSTAEHEIGHTLGLRHNFEGSTDALNFPDKYWELRGAKGQPLDKPTQAQLQAGIQDYAYASIMDYSDSFHADIHGVGYYDDAAIAFGYGQLVEVFANKPVDPVTEVLPLGSALRSVRHYTSIPDMLGGVDKIGQRKLVPYAEVIADMTGEGSTPGKGRAKVHSEVPYRFCSDEYVAGTPTCNVFDRGADAYEIVDAGLQKYRDHYILNAFRRDRVDFTTEGYIGRIWDRYFMPIVLQYQNWVFDQSPYDYGKPGELWDYLRTTDAAYYGIEDVPWEQAAQGGLVATESVRTGLERLAQVIGTPEPGGYCLDTDTNTFWQATTATDLPVCPTPVGCTDACVDVNVPLGIGRFAYTEFDEATGYYYYDRLRHIGAYYDKLGAILMLTDPSTYFVGVDSSQSVNNYILPISLYFGKELNGLLGAVAAGREDMLGAVRGKDGKLQLRKLFGAEAAAQVGLPAVALQDTFMLRSDAMFYGMAWLNALLDQTFNDSMKIWLEGHGEAFTPIPGADIATFVNPTNMRTYHSVKLATAGLFSPGYTMVKDAQKRADQYAAKPGDEWAKYLADDTAQWLDIARGYYDIFGYAWF